MRPTDFVGRVQRKVALSAVAPSMLRGQGRGLVGCAHGFLAALSLQRIPRSSERRFMAWLDRQTRALDEAFPSRSRRWAAARKVINIFLRDALYNRYLNRAFRLSPVEPWLEVPLDGLVAARLKKLAARGTLPRWQGLKRATREECGAFQQFAQEAAETMGVERVHLDIYLWVDGKEAGASTGLGLHRRPPWNRK